jgi:site-specific DNA recombinase
MKKKATNPTNMAPQVRVAVYTRQSVASELEFGSIDAQRESVEAYVASQRSEGWVTLPDRYDDHGFSGGNIDRPAFQRLLADVEAGKVDVVATYKIDRASRSLTDFTAFMATLERRGVGFVSTTQSFDTRTSMGRLTLNILASFSQFERETIAERTRDKIAATRKKGLWTGGRPPLGYDIRDKQLVVNASEAQAVTAIFQTYLEQGGLVATVAELARRGVTNKSWTNRGGKQVRGRPFDKTSLRGLLTNPVLLGKVRCGTDLVDAKHDAIVDPGLFAEVQAALRDHRHVARTTPGKWGAILSGILHCGRCGAAMTHAANIRGNRTHRYYVCQTSMKQGAAACPGSRAPAGELEEVVLGRIRAIGRDPEVLVATIRAAREARLAQQPELVAEARRITNERTDLAGQRKNLLDALAGGGVAANAIAGRLGEVDQQMAKLQARHAEVTAQLAAIQNDTVDEAALREALKQFTPVWDELIPRERARLLRLLVEEVSYNGAAGELEIRFRPNGIRGLGHEVKSRRPA